MLGGIVTAGLAIALGVIVWAAWEWSQDAFSGWWLP